MKEDIGKRIKLALRKANISQRDMADLVHVHESTFSSYCAGRAEPQAQTMVTIANTCDVSLGWLISGEGEMEKGPALFQEIGRGADDIFCRLDRSPLSEPIKKTIKILLENEDKAWELYATILERAERSRSGGDKQ